MKDFIAFDIYLLYTIHVQCTYNVCSCITQCITRYVALLFILITSAFKKKVDEIMCYNKHLCLSYRPTKSYKPFSQIIDKILLGAHSPKSMYTCFSHCPWILWNCSQSRSFYIQNRFFHSNATSGLYLRLPSVHMIDSVSNVKSVYIWRNILKYNVLILELHNGGTLGVLTSE